MAWQGPIFTQNGNTEGTWWVSGGGVHPRDVVVLEPVAGNSALRLIWVEKRLNPARHYVRVRVVGANAMAFRVRGGRGY